MKQGKASLDVMAGTKVEPRPHAVLPGGVAQLGQMQGNHAMNSGKLPNVGLPLNAGRGLKAPMAGQTNHKGGSQGRY